MTRNFQLSFPEQDPVTPKEKEEKKEKKTEQQQKEDHNPHIYIWVKWDKHSKKASVIDAILCGL